jgi:hypothetical protein
MEFMKVVVLIMTKHKPQFSKLGFSKNFTIKKRPKHYLGLLKWRRVEDSNLWKI